MCDFRLRFSVACMSFPHDKIIKAMDTVYRVGFEFMRSNVKVTRPQSG